MSSVVSSRLVLASTVLAIAGCSLDLANGGEAAPDSSEHTDSADDAPWRLTVDQLTLPDGLEPVAHPVRLKAGGDSSSEPAAGQGGAHTGPLAEDPSWFAADGTPYEAMLVLEDGTAFGRRAEPPSYPEPGPSNAYGAYAGELPSEEDFLGGVRALDLGEEVGTITRVRPKAQHPVLSSSSAGLLDEVFDLSHRLRTPDRSEGPIEAKGILGGWLFTDRRTRTTGTTTLTSYPIRTIGALNQVEDAGFTNCTGTKIGPRHVLTASHCVFDYTGWTPSGWFHPGQTNSGHPNTGGTAVRWSGVYARNYYGGDPYRRWDYAVLYLEDRQDSFNLHWLGIAWWNNSLGYAGRNVIVRGYPHKASTEDKEKCLASALSSKNCDGWMYTDSHELDALAFRSDEQLEYDIDTTPGQSGSSPYANVNGVWVTLGVHWGCDAFGGCGNGGGRNRAARFRTAMFNDVCSWVALVSSAWGQHPLCN